MMGLLSSAVRRVRARTYLWFVGGNLLLALLAAAWLKIPDSHVWELLISLVVGSGLLIAWFALNAKVVQAIRRVVDPVWIVLAGALLAGAVVLMWLPHLVAASIDAGSSRRAGYWNSQMSAHWRTTFTYERLSSWQTDVLGTVAGFVIPALLLPLVVEVVSRRMWGEVWRNGARCLRRWQYWLTMIVAAWVGSWVWGRMLEWQPGKTVRGEVVSFVARMTVLVVFESLLVVGVLGVVSELLAREQALRDGRGDTGA